MIPLFNLHSHTTMCDGRHTPEEMVKKAISLGCDGLGFSGHSYIERFNPPKAKKMRGEDYIAEISRLKEKYKDSLEILLGIEYDMLSELDTRGYDYIIGAVHLLDVDGEILSVDNGEEIFVSAVNDHFGGDFYAFCKKYYQDLSEVTEKTKGDIVAHFDLVTKFNEGNKYFDEGDSKYRNAAFECLDALLEKDPIFEINTGAIGRGYRKKPYPADFIIKRIAEKGGRMTLTTDCHDADKLLCFYVEAAELAYECGIRELYYPKNGIFVPYSIE